MSEFGLGHGVPRIEDGRFLTGRGRYSDDINLPGQARAVFLRSPHANALLKSIDASAAEAAPGVLAVYTGADVQADGLGNLPTMGNHKRRGEPMYRPPHHALARDQVRFAGDAVAMVVAETLAQARDAAELIAVEYEALSQVTGTAEALAPGAPVVWPECPDNICFEFEAGDRTRVDAAFKTAAHITSLDIVVNRVSAAPMEPRAAVAQYDPGDERYTLYTGVQNPHATRRIFSAILGVPETQMRVVSPDMGGGFGMRSDAYGDLILVLWASRKLDRPVKWTGERMEAFVNDNQARDNITRVELALDGGGKFLALKVETLAALGAYLALGATTPPTINVGGLVGVYTTPAVHVRVQGVFTNTPSTSPYRGAGRPEASYAIERVIDTAARELGIDPIDLRKRNLIPADAMPYDTKFVFEYDSGEFEKNQDSVVELIEWAEFDARREESRKNGKLRGIGIANTIARSAAMGEETAELRFDPSGSVTLLMGTHSHGQGHETVFRQLLSDALGLAPEKVRYVQGDTDQVAHGVGTFGSRSSGLGGSALVRATEKIIKKGTTIAAHLLEAADDDIEFRDSGFHIKGTDRSVSLAEVARATYTPGGLPPGIEPAFGERAAFAPVRPTFPNGAHAAEVEIDPETGQVTLERYCAVDDVGTIMNPLLMHGQVHGGIVQGVGQLLMEDIVWDQSGQPVAASFLDYTMPRADTVPSFKVASNVVPTTTNPLGVKGVGEAGTVGALPCVMNAIVDALAPLGVRTLDMPATPERVWRAIQKAAEEEG